jgi:SAM-dependent methyltransferase
MTTTHPPNTVYDLPNTSIEHSRLNTQARLTRKVTGNKVIHAPLLTSPLINKVLDIGCGPGVVTREFSDIFPAAKVVGVDIKVLPTLLESPQQENVDFIEGDIMDLANQHLELENGSFDYVFSRYLVYALTCWPEYVKTAYDLLKPGAWVEIQDGKLKTMLRRTGKEADLEWETALHDADRGMGLDPDIGGRLEGLVRETGFENVGVWEYEVPLSTWEGMDPGMEEVGRFYEKAMPVLLGTLMRTRLAGRVSEDRIERYIEQMRKDFGSGEGYYIKFFVVVGQKGSI